MSGAVRYASIVTLLGAWYYLQAQLWVRLWIKKRAHSLRRNVGFDLFKRRCKRGQYYNNRRGRYSNECSELDQYEQSQYEQGQYERTETTSEGSNVIDPSHQSSQEEIPPPLMEDDVARSQNVYYPELTMGSVWTYVYGWGLLLFVCVYCMAAIDVPASCWWAMGMIVLSFDELISKGVKNFWVIVLGGLLAVSVFSLWGGSLMDKDGKIMASVLFSSKSTMLLFDFIMGVFYPVAAPFIFFTVRSTARSVTQDVNRLCEFAMPFMVVLSLCSLVATSGACDGLGGAITASTTSSANRRLLGNETVMVETVAKFASSYVSSTEGQNTSLMHIFRANHTLNYTLLFLSPFAALWLLRVLIIAVLAGHATEFITCFLLVVSTRYGITHEYSTWSASAAGCAGVVLVLLLMVRRS